jgi:phosphoglycolate phosphatase
MNGSGHVQSSGHVHGSRHVQSSGQVQGRGHVHGSRHVRSSGQVEGSRRVRCLYLDLDGTLLGRRASLLHDGEGAVTIDGVRAVQACLRAGVEVVLMSGRRRAQVFEDARLLGQSSYIFEAGACVVLDGEEHWLTGELLPGELTIAEQIDLSGAPALLLEQYAGRLEYHEPWHVQREVSHLFRGLVDSVEVDRLLAEHGHAGLRLVDNGVVNRRSPALAELPLVRGYHLVPVGASKAGAVELHRRARGYERAETFAVGDSREDLACAPQVDVFWLVANGLERDPSIRESMAAYDNVRVAEAGYGPGVYEAVLSTLMNQVAPASS